MGQRDEELMVACQTGDEHAMPQIFVNNKRRIFNFCYGLLGNRADAEEVAADVFLALLRSKHAYDPARTFSTWLFTIARNLCFNRMRKRKQTVSLCFFSGDSKELESWDVVDDKGEDSRESLAKKERAQQVRRAIAGLPFEQKEAMELRQYQGFSYAEISGILGCSLEKVKILIFRAKENLRNDLASLIKEERS